MSTPRPANRVHGTFGLAPRHPHFRREAAFAAGVFAVVVLLGIQLTTQWMASELGHQRALGHPMATGWLGPVYAPWRLALWYFRLPATASAEPLLSTVRQLLGITLVAGFTSGLAVIIRRHRRSGNRTTELHGSARWAERQDIEAAGLFAKEGVVVGQWEDQGAKRLRWLRSDGPEHLLLFAPTGSGKGVGPVLSTLLTWGHSMVVLDPKGENFQLTSGWRSTFSRVFRLDFTAEPGESTAFNPLAEIRIRSSREVADVQRVAYQLLSPAGAEHTSEAGRYFIDAGADLLAGAILHVLYRESAKGRVATLTDVSRELANPDEGHTHSAMLNDWLSYMHDPAYVQGWVDGSGARTATHPFVAQSARTQRNRDPKDRSPILSTVDAKLALFRDPLLTANTARSDFSIAELVTGDRPVTVYLVPRIADQERLRPLIRLLLDMWIARLTEDTVFSSPSAGRASKRRRLLFLLDEFPALGKLPIIETALAMARGWGLKFFLIAQDYEQIVGAWGRNESLFSNCGIRAAFTPNKPETARLLSALAGFTTVLKENATRSGPLGAPMARNQSLSEQEVKRELLTPDECMRLPGARKTGGDQPRITEAGDMLVFAAGYPGIYAKQPLYFQDRTLLARARMKPASARPTDIVLRAAAALPPIAPNARPLPGSETADDPSPVVAATTTAESARSGTAGRAGIATPPTAALTDDALLALAGIPAPGDEEEVDDLASWDTDPGEDDDPDEGSNGDDAEDDRDEAEEDES